MRPFDRLLSILLVSGLVLSQLGGCGRAPETPADSYGSGGGLALTGAGSTFAAPFFEKLMEVYRVDHPELRLSYEAVGSGEGIDRFLAGGVNVDATDTPLSAEEAEGVAGDILQLPVTAGMIAITYNLSGLESPLNLPCDVYADIFLGKIDRWSDPRIVAANPGVDLPHKLIQIVARLDSSGTTFAFTNHLAAISPDWASGPGVGKRIDWSGGTILRVQGNNGLDQSTDLVLVVVGVRPVTTLGAGAGVSKRVDIFAAALHRGMSVEDLNELDLSYTPPLSSPWDPVQMAAQAWVAAWRKTEATA